MERTVHVPQAALLPAGVAGGGGMGSPGPLHFDGSFQPGHPSLAQCSPLD